MSTGRLETVLIGNIVDGELFAGLLINPAVAAVHNNGFVIGANILQLAFLSFLGTITGFQAVNTFNY